MNHAYRLWGSLLVATATAFAQNVSVTGTVVNSASGAALAGVVVTMLGTGLKDTTTGDGRFSITGTLAVRSSAGNVTPGVARLSGRQVEFRVPGEGTTHADVSLFDIQGRRIPVFSGQLTGGATYRFALPRNPAPGAWVCRIDAGATIALLAVADGQASRQKMLSASMTHGGVALMQAVGAMDSLSLRKRGFVPRRAHIGSYETDVGEVRVSALALDSLGYYNEPPSNAFQKDLAAKMPEFWAKCATLQTIVIGSSTAEAAVAPALLTSLLPAYNFAYPGADPLAVRTMLTKYVLPHCSQLKLVIMGLDFGWMGLDGGDWSWGDGTANTRGYRYDRNHGFWSEGLPDSFSQYVADAPYPSSTIPPADLGWLKLPANGWGKWPYTAGAQFTGPWTVNDPSYIANFDSLRQAIGVATSRGVRVVAIETPRHPGYDTTAFYGRYGPRWETARAILAQTQALADSLPLFDFYDANKQSKHDYLDSILIYDVDHLADAGARRFTGRLDSVLTRHP